VCYFSPVKVAASGSVQCSDIAVSVTGTTSGRKNPLQLSAKIFMGRELDRPGVTREKDAAKQEMSVCMYMCLCTYEKKSMSFRTTS